MDQLLETIAAGVAVLYRDREIQEVEDLLGRMLTQQEYEQVVGTLNRVTEMLDESAEKLNAMAAQIIAENAPTKRARKPRSRKPRPELAPLPDASTDPDPGLTVEFAVPLRGSTPVIDLTLVGRLRKKLPLADAIERAKTVGK